MDGDSATQLDPADIQRIALAAAKFNELNPDNDPHSKLDLAFFSVTFGDRSTRKCFFKFDYYDPTLSFGSESPEDTSCTVRVLTLGFASDR